MSEPPGFGVLTGAEPDEIDLELRSLGAAMDARAAARIDRAPLPRDDLRAWERWWTSHRPPLPSSPPGPSARRTAFVLLAAVAALIAAFSLARPAAPLRPMGGLPVDVAVTRGSEPLSPPFRLRPGDDVRVRLVAPTDGVVEVWTIQDDGAVSTIEEGEPVRAGGRFVLDGAARLDDHPGREWLVVDLVPAVRDADAIEAEARGLLPDPTVHATPRRFVLDVTRSR